MPIDSSSSQYSAADQIRMRAAALFAAAARTTADIDGSARLHCLAAHGRLTRGGAEPVRHARQPLDQADATDAVTLVRTALKLLGSLPLTDFAADDVREASVDGRRALRRLP